MEISSQLINYISKAGAGVLTRNQSVRIQALLSNTAQHNRGQVRVHEVMTGGRVQVLASLHSVNEELQGVVVEMEFNIVPSPVGEVKVGNAHIDWVVGADPGTKLQSSTFQL